MTRSIRRFGVSAFGAILFIAHGVPAAEQDDGKAPAFSAADLTALPARNWITNGGNLYNQRYSRLDQINRGNVQDVKAVWRVGLNGSGVGPGYSQQAQLLFYEGVLYAVTGDDDVFAVDVETGKFLWTYEADVDFKTSVVCCGRLSRGVGLGDGKIFLGRLDGRLIALDQRSGEVVWDVQAADPKQGYGITAAPLYLNNRAATIYAGSNEIQRNIIAKATLAL